MSSMNIANKKAEFVKLACAVIKKNFWGLRVKWNMIKSFFVTFYKTQRAVEDTNTFGFFLAPT